MPKDKTETHQKILPAAMAEFLSKGFEKATMRDIAAAAGITAAGLYRHFADKEAMFAALVEPVLAQCDAWYAQHKAEDYGFLERGDLEAMWYRGTELTMMLDLVYENFDAFKLLLCRSEGTKYASFLHDFVMLEQQETLLYLEAARARGVPVRDVKPEELHLLLTAYAGAMFEVVVHDFSKEDAAHYLKTLEEFFTPGWRTILGL